MPRRVELISAGMAQLLHDPGVRRDLERRAARVEAAARASSRSPSFRDSLHTMSTTTDRVAVRVGSNHPKVRVIEARSGVLARSVGAAGGSS